MSERKFGETPDDWAKREVREIARQVTDNPPQPLNDDELRARVTELESALRLALSLSPDDPVLIIPLEKQVAALEQERDEAKEVARKEWSERLRLYDVIDAERNKVESLSAQLSTARERISGALSRLSVITNCDEGMGTHCIDVLCQDVIPLLESVATAKGNTNEAAEGESDG